MSHDNGNHGEQPVIGALGRSVIRRDSWAKVRGAAKYGADLPAGPECLWAAVVRSPHPHADILSISTDAALAVPGVVAVYTARDVPGTNTHGLVRRDQELLATRKVRYVGDPVALVVAKGKRSAWAGRDALTVEYRPLPGVFSIDESEAPGAPLVHAAGNRIGGQKIRKGDPLRALQEEAEVVVEATFETQSVDHAFLDTEAGVAYLDGDVLTIAAAGQWVHEERRILALALGLPLEKVRIIQPVTGGAFGGREDLGIQLYLGLAALLSGSRVKLEYNRKESMVARHKRHPMRIHYQLGAKRDGTLVCAIVDAKADEGAYASTGMPVLRKVASHATGPYRVPHVQVDSVGFFTNHNPTGAMRGFGASQIAIAYEGVMDRLADALGMDRADLRRRNLLKSGEEVTTSQRLQTATAQECMERALELIGWEQRSYLAPVGHLRRGYGLSVICFGLGYGDGYRDMSQARLRFNLDDRLEVYTGAVEVGQGVLEVAAQIAAHALGVPLERVDVFAADTALTPDAGSSSATRQTLFTGSAIRLAALELRRQVVDVASQLLGLHLDELTISGSSVVQKSHPANEISLEQVLAEGRRRGWALEATGHFEPVTICQDSGGQSPLPFITYLFAAHAAQITVDIETGVVKVDRIVAVHDVGKAINPMQVAGQIEGGVLQGLGMALLEEVQRLEGRILNPNFTDYLLPTTMDAPEIVAEILETPDLVGPFGARGVGEPPLIAAPPAILSAIKDAIGTPIAQTPATPERVWRAIQGVMFSQSN